jgi:hypothetical protein
VGNFRDLTGQTFGRLTAVKIVGKTKPSRGSYIWMFSCACGGTTEKVGSQVVNGHTASCGCLHSEGLAKRNTTHGLSHLPEYTIWLGIIKRCENKKHKAYKNYGGRGISISKEWRNSFEQFLADVGSRPSETHSIDRINNNGNYEAGNCRWATYSEQALNTRCVTTFLNGEKITKAAFCKKHRIDHKALMKRLNAGKTMEQINDELSSRKDV